jgi:hypothetical protein
MSSITPPQAPPPPTTVVPTVPPTKFSITHRKNETLNIPKVDYTSERSNNTDYIKNEETKEDGKRKKKKGSSWGLLKEPRRSSFSWSSLKRSVVGEEGKYCIRKVKDELIGHSGTTLFLRLVLLLPNIILCIVLCIIPTHQRHSLAIDAIRIAFQLFSWSCLNISRSVAFADQLRPPRAGMADWGPFEMFEVLTVLASSVANTLITYGTDPFPQQVGTSFVFFFVFQPILHPLITQIMDYKKHRFTTWIASASYKLFLTMSIALFFCVYCYSVLFGSAPSNVESTALIPIALSPKYSCKNKTIFLSLFANSTISQDGCPRGSGGIGKGKFCGFDTWEQACWGVGLSPAAHAVQYSVVTLSIHVFICLMFSLVFDGRGMIKLNRKGGVHKDTLRLLTKRSTMIVLFALIINMLIALFHLGTLFVNGSFMSNPAPSIVPERIVLPSYCYGGCQTNLYLFYFFLLIVAGLAGKYMYFYFTCMYILLLCTDITELYLFFIVTF